MSTVPSFRINAIVEGFHKAVAFRLSGGLQYGLNPAVTAL